MLISEQRTALKSRHGNERDKRVCDRIKAVLLYEKCQLRAKFLR